MKLNKKVFAVVMGLAITASGSAFAATADSFTDVPKDHWSYQALDYLAKRRALLKAWATARFRAVAA